MSFQRTMLLAALSWIVGCGDRMRPGEDVAQDAVGPDVTTDLGEVGPDAVRFDVVPGDGPAPDVADMDGPRPDATSNDGGDAPTGEAGDVFVIPMDTLPPVDVALPDVPAVDGGPCGPVGPATVLGAESRVLSRAVFVRAETRAYSIAASVQRAGGENIWMQRVRMDGTDIVTRDVSMVMPGREVRGGANDLLSELYTVAYSSNETGNNDIYVVRAQSNLLPITTPLAVVRDAASSETPQVVARRGGSMVGWRSVESGIARVLVATTDLGLGSASAAVAVTPAGENVVSFALVAQPAISATEQMYAVVYVVESGATRTIRVQALDVMGAASGSPIDVASGTDLGANVTAVGRAQDLVVAWAQPAGSGMRVRRIGVLPGGAGTSTAMTVATAAAPAQVAISDDGTGFVLGYRSGGGATAAVAITRLTTTLAVRDTALASSAGPGGPVGVAAAGDGTYAIGWADDFVTGTVVRLQVLRCP